MDMAIPGYSAVMRSARRHIERRCKHMDCQDGMVASGLVPCPKCQTARFLLDENYYVVHVEGPDRPFSGAMHWEECLRCAYLTNPAATIETLKRAGSVTTLDFEDRENPTGDKVIDCVYDFDRSLSVLNAIPLNG